MTVVRSDRKLYDVNKKYHELLQSYGIGGLCNTQLNACEVRFRVDDPCENPQLDETLECALRGYCLQVDPYLCAGGGAGRFSIPSLPSPVIYQLFSFRVSSIHHQIARDEGYGGRVVASHPCNSILCHTQDSKPATVPSRFARRPV